MKNKILVIVGSLALAVLPMMTRADATTTPDFSNWMGLQVPADWMQSQQGPLNGSSYINSSGLLAWQQFQDGPRLIKLANDATVYWVSEHNEKMPILTRQVFLSYHNKDSDVATVSQDEFDYYPTATYIQLMSGGKVYFVQDGVKHYISSDLLDQTGIDPNADIIIVNQTELNSYKNGPNITADVTVG